MRRYSKWFVASLIMPIITMLAVFLNFTYTSSTQVLTLIFWPSSIFLMSLGGIIGVVFYLLRSCVRKQGNENL